jgi:type II secretory pathway pseudopilin PulG
MLRQFTNQSQKGFIPISGIEGLLLITGVLTSIVLSSLNSARAKSRDARRLANIRMISSSLELYYNEHSTYPENLRLLEPKYIGTVPIPPTPPDGNCTVEENNFNYIRINKSQYSLTFCLGQTTSNYNLGVRKLTEKGIK